MTFLHVITDAVSLVPLDDPKGGTNWDAPAAPPPGMGTVGPQWIGWAKWVAIVAGILGLISCGVMMMVGRRNRSHLAAEGAGGLLWTVAGLSIVTLSAGVVPQIIS